ncbi:sodium:proton antiporter [Desulfobacterales bacterium HSG17]|nr:sodium:proton antiporter [Desulfobacterales bacterium HSG17]
MEPINAIAVLITFSAIFAYLNHRFLKISMSIALMVMSLFFSLALLLLDHTGLPISAHADKLVNSIDFSRVLLEGMLGLLLFAGALHLNLNDLAVHKIEIAIYSTFGVITSTFLVGSFVYGLSCWIGWELRVIDCLLFGALISPTDPIAVLGILKSIGAPKSLETKIAGESLFNDGIGVVVFLVLLEIATGTDHVTAGYVASLFIKEAVGGILFGLAAGYLAYRLLKSVNNYQVEIMITLALVIGGYALGTALHISAPLAMVAAGLLIGNHGRRLAMSHITRQHIDMFWELVDEILNALLFVLIGMEVLVLTLKWEYLMAGMIAIPVALFSRFISIGGTITIMKRWKTFVPGAVSIMTWGGLRGGISVALALSLPEQCHRDLIITMTYVVVAFSVLVQGLTIKMLVKKCG